VTSQKHLTNGTCYPFSKKKNSVSSHAKGPFYRSAHQRTHLLLPLPFRGSKRAPPRLAAASWRRGAQAARIRSRDRREKGRQETTAAGTGQGRGLGGGTEALACSLGPFDWRQQWARQPQHRPRQPGRWGRSPSTCSMPGGRRAYSRCGRGAPAPAAPPLGPADPPAVARQAHSWEPPAPAHAVAPPPGPAPPLVARGCGGRAFAGSAESLPPPPSWVY
jgi:hypothetical protein